MLHPDARISATMQVKIQSHPGERWTVSCCALNKRDGRSLTLKTAQLLYQYAVMAKIAAHESSEKNRRKTISYNNLRRKLSALNFCQNRKT